MVINEFDDQALEEGTGQGGDRRHGDRRRVAIGRDRPGASPRRARSRSAGRRRGDRGRRRDSRTAALAFAEAFRQLAPDLVLTGVQTPSDVFGQTAPYLAATLGWPQASVVVGVSVPDGTVRVQQEYAGGPGRARPPLPAVVGVQSASSPPSTSAMARLRQAMTEASIETLEVSVEPPAAGSKLGLARAPGATGPGDDNRGRCRGRGRADRRTAARAGGRG